MVNGNDGDGSSGDGNKRDERVRKQVKGKAIRHGEREGNGNDLV